MTLLQAILIALVQGITELFPISSVAHGVIMPHVLGWQLDPQFLKENYLPFLVMLHLGTAAALLLYFRAEWFGFARAVLTNNSPAARREFALIIVATVPAALLGALLEKALRGLFSSPVPAAFFLLANGFLLFFGERQRSKGTRDITDLTYQQAALVGLAQALALIPGFSRSGASMVAGFWVGLRHEAAARFSMLLATPIILGAGVLEVPKLLHMPDHSLLQTAVIGGLVAGLFAYLSVWVLMRWFKKNEVDAMRPFALYCWAAGALVLMSVVVGG
jgi:undecaprenyl-diphosphatase